MFVRLFQLRHKAPLVSELNKGCE